MDLNSHYRNTCLLSTGHVETKYTLEEPGCKNKPQVAATSHITPVQRSLHDSFSFLPYFFWIDLHVARSLLSLGPLLTKTLP